MMLFVWSVLLVHCTWGVISVVAGSFRRQVRAVRGIQGSRLDVIVVDDGVIAGELSSSRGHHRGVVNRDVVLAACDRLRAFS